MVNPSHPLRELFESNGQFSICRWCHKRFEYKKRGDKLKIPEINGLCQHIRDECAPHNRHPDIINVATVNRPRSLAYIKCRRDQTKTWTWPILRDHPLAHLDESRREQVAALANEALQGVEAEVAAMVRIGTIPTQQMDPRALSSDIIGHHGETSPRSSDPSPLIAGMSLGYGHQLASSTVNPASHGFSGEMKTSFQSTPVPSTGHSGLQSYVSGQPIQLASPSFPLHPARTDHLPSTYPHAHSIPAYQPITAPPHPGLTAGGYSQHLIYQQLANRSSSAMHESRPAQRRRLNSAAAIPTLATATPVEPPSGPYLSQPTLVMPTAANTSVNPAMVCPTPQALQFPEGLPGYQRDPWGRVVAPWSEHDSRRLHMALLRLGIRLGIRLDDLTSDAMREFVKVLQPRAEIYPAHQWILEPHVVGTSVPVSASRSEDSTLVPTPATAPSFTSIALTMAAAAAASATAPVPTSNGGPHPMVHDSSIAMSSRTTSGGGGLTIPLGPAPAAHGEQVFIGQFNFSIDFSGGGPQPSEAGEEGDGHSEEESDTDSDEDHEA